MLGVVAPLHSPKLGDLIERMPAINLVVAKHMQGLAVGLCEGLCHNRIFLRGVGKIAEL